MKKLPFKMEMEDGTERVVGEFEIDEDGTIRGIITDPEVIDKLTESYSEGYDKGFQEALAEKLRGEPRRRLKACVENWPDCEDGKYDPRCCRFPKSCSCLFYDAAIISEDKLEPKEQ